MIFRTHHYQAAWLFPAEEALDRHIQRQRVDRRMRRRATAALVPGTRAGAILATELGCPKAHTEHQRK
jgi:hypothetical protein